MESYKAESVNKLSSFEVEGLPSDFFVDESAIVRENELRDGVNSFPMHRKLLRRRHVRKLQKTKQRERQWKEEEQKLKALTRDRDRKRRAEKKGDLHDNKIISRAKLSAKRPIYSTGINKKVILTESPPPIRRSNFRGGIKNNGNFNASNCVSSPTSVMDLQRLIMSTPMASPTTNIDGSRKLSGTTLIAKSTRHKKVDSRDRTSFSLPEFSPVRPTKFRKLQL